jgi:hypothetical protein
VSEIPGGLFTFESLDAAVQSSVVTAQGPPSLGITVTGNRSAKFATTDLFLLKADAGFDPIWQMQTSAAMAINPSMSC